LRHPSEYYIRYLLATYWGNQDAPLELDGLNETLGELGLLSISQGQFDRLRSTFQPPADYDFGDSVHPPTVQFMKENKIHTLWQPNECMDRILTELLGEHGDKSYQHDLHILLMGGVPHEVIAKKINKKYRLYASITNKMVEVYEHYFWRRRNLTRVEWAVLVQGHPFFDDYMAPLVAGEQQALFRAGMNPKYDCKQSLRDAHRQISFRVQHLAFHADCDGTTKNLTRLTRELRALYAILYGEGGGYEEELKEIRHWITVHMDPKIQAITDLVGPNGSYSGDGSDTKETKEPGTESEEGDGGNANA
jgi:hypothetical protein